MGASDSKLVFKKGIFRLSEERSIPPDDSYWTSFWELPESAEDVFSLFSPADIRRTRDNAIENLETLLLAVCSRLIVLRHHPSFPDPDLAPERHALNCVRVMTRILPYLYELESLHDWEDNFFWAHRRKRTRSSTLANEVLFDESLMSPRLTEEDFEDAKPLGEELMDTIVDFLFFSELTVPKQPKGSPKVSYSIWQSGVGCNTTIPTTREFESNRSEILRLLLTMTSRSMYLSPAVLPGTGIKALTHICTCSDKQVVLSVLCSLLNTTLKYNPATWRVPYNAIGYKDAKQVLVTYSLQMLLAMIIYPIPETIAGLAPKNYYRHFLGRLHRVQDFQFIVDGLTRVLNQPLQSNASYIPGTQTITKFVPEMIMLFWEVTQCNKRFRSFIIDTDRVYDFVVIILFHALEYKSDASKQGVVRTCAFVLQTLSVEKNFGIALNKPFPTQDTLPHTIKIAGFKGSYADFLIQSIYNLISTSNGKLSAIYPALLAVINNISAYMQRLNSTTCSKILQLFNSMSSPSFLLANDSNHTLLQSILESLNAFIEHQYKKNPELVFAILKNRKKFEALRSFTLESGQEEIERRNRNRKDGASASDPFDFSSSRSSVESLRSPTSVPRTPSLSNVPEDGTFAIGDEDEDDSDEDDHRPTPSQSTPSENPSRASSVAGVEDAVPVQLRGMSEKARGKMPAGAPTFSRQNSLSSLGEYAMAGPSGMGAFEPTVRWIDTWLPELPLHTILTSLQQLVVLIPRERLSADHLSPELHHILSSTEIVGVDPSPPRVHSFEWSPMALGWYESLLWGLIFTAELQVSKGSMGLWTGTSIKLFKVQETAAQGPTLTSPRGAVDAVGSNIVNRIGSLNLRGSGAGGSASDASPGAGSGVGNGNGSRNGGGGGRSASAPVEIDASMMRGIDASMMRGS